MEDQTEATQEKENNSPSKEVDLQVAKILLDMMGYWEHELEARTPDNNNYKEVEDEQEKRQAERNQGSEPDPSTFYQYNSSDSNLFAEPSLDLTEEQKQRWKDNIDEGIEHDPVDNPSHYMLFDGDIEVIDLVQDRLTEEEFLGYLKGNMIKYHMRAGHKGNLTQDLQKLRKYTEWLLEMTGA